MKKPQDILTMPHDELEALYRPHFAFEGLDLLTQEYQKQLRSGLLHG